MAALASVFVRVLPDAKQFEPQLKKQLNKVDAKHAGAKAGKSFAGGMARALGGALAAIGGVRLLGGFVADAEEAQKIGKLTAQVVKTTGGAANITAGQVAKLAEAISNKTGVDDEAVQSGQNLLLTFTNVRNEVGKGNAIFDRASAAVIDMAAAMNKGEVTQQGVKSASIQLGKALNDPIKGVSALSKVGVSFTAQQKKQIKTLVESGDTLGAQKIILKEMGKEFGGAAAAAAGPLDKLKVVAGNLGEEVGTFLLPYIEQFAKWLTDKGIPAVKRIGAAFKRDWLPPIKSVAEWIGRNRDVLVPLVATIAAAVAVVKVVTTVMKIWTVVTYALGVAMKFAAANPIGLIITVIGALVALVIVAWKKNEKFREVVKTVWNNVKLVISTVIDTVKRVVGGWVSSLQTAWGNIKLHFRQGVAGAKLMMLNFADAIIKGGKAAFGWIPGMEGKFEALETWAREARKGINSELKAIHDENIMLNIKARSANINASYLAREASRGGATGADRYLGNGSGGLNFSTSSTGVTAAARKQRNDATDIYSAGLRHMLPRWQLPAPKVSPGAGPPGKAGFPLPRGKYRVGRGSAAHGYNSQDFPSPKGTPVYAIRAGVAATVKRLSTSYGWHTIIGHAAGLSSLYAHLSALYVRPGQRVSAGQMIGRVGSTGNSTGPHLHFEARSRGARINPRSVLKYDDGGWLPTGASVTVNNTGKPERIMAPHDEMSLDKRTILELAAAIGAEVLAGSRMVTGDALTGMARSSAAGLRYG